MLQVLLLILVPLIQRVSSKESDRIYFTEGSSPPWRLRLPETVKPIHYHLLIHPNLTFLNFTGRVHIQLDVQRDVGHVILHSKKLYISRADVLQSDDAHHPLRVYHSEAFEQIALFAPDFVFKKGEHVVRLEFSANLSHSFHGFYKSSYRTQSGEVRSLASTHFEPTHARAAFPCFDEPAFKANFSIRIRRGPNHISISNMPKLKTVVLTPDLLEDRYDVSVKMSTYLVAFIVCDFVSISKKSEHGVQISVYTVSEKINQADYALNTAVKLLDFYDQYFGIPYPLPKQDLAAIPDFQSGAMENWGLTTYRESGLLFDPERSPVSDKLGITKVIAHELAHQWFGNLVTMRWWNDLWLNEGFAKFMEFVSTNITYPDLQVNDYFLEKCFTAMDVDSLSSSHPISNPVENPEEIREMFDDVSYQKGACVLNMLRDFLTPEVFNLGMMGYLKKHSYQNTVSADLWDSLTNICDSDHLDVGRLNTAGFCSDSQTSRSSVSKWFLEDNLNVKALMDTWTLQEGFPVITVRVKGPEVQFKQERFQKWANTSKDSSFNWHVPLTYITSSSSSVQRFLLKNRKDVLYLPTEVEWIKFNVDMRGYYIVHYETRGWEQFIKQLQHNHTVFSGNDRANLIHDVFQLVKMGKVPLDKALSLSLYLKRETEIMAVTRGFGELVSLYKLMEKRNMTALEHQLKAYLVSLFQGLIDIQTWNDEGSVSERILRNYLLLFACVRRYAPCVSVAQELFLKWKESGGDIRLPADIRLVVYTEGARTEEGWDFLMEMYRHTVYPSEKSQIKAALCYSPLAHKLDWLMNQSLNGDVVKTHHLPSLVISISKNPNAYQLAWNFLRSNWPELVHKFDLGSSSISRMVVEVTKHYSTPEMLEEVRSFFGTLQVNMGAGLRSIQQALENIEENIHWMEKNIPLLTDWLARK